MKLTILNQTLSSQKANANTLSRKLQLRILHRLRVMTMLKPYASPCIMARTPAHAETNMKPRAPNLNVPSQWSATKIVLVLNLPRFLVVSWDLSESLSMSSMIRVTAHAETVMKPCTSTFDVPTRRVKRKYSSKEVEHWKRDQDGYSSCSPSQLRTFECRYPTVLFARLLRSFSKLSPDVSNKSNLIPN